MSITFRDELYRTARDVSMQASQPDNVKEIDRYVLSLCARGDLDAFKSMLMDGYDHIVDLTDDEENTIAQVAKARGHDDLYHFLETVHDFEVSKILIDCLS